MNQALHASRRLGDGILRRFGIDATIFRALVKAYLLMDFRNQQFGRATGAKPREIFSPLFWVLGQNLLITLCYSVVLFARVEIFFFAFVAIGVSIAVTASSLIVEFNEVVLSPDDQSVLAHQPIPIRTYSAARVANLLVYVLAIITSLNLIPTIVIHGFRESLWWHGAALAFVSIGASLLTAAVVILVYVLLMNRNWSRLQELLAWVQAGFILVFFFGGQYLLRDSTQQVQMVAYRLPEWIYWTPPAWLAAVIHPHDWAADWQRLAIFASTGVLTLSAWALVIVALSKAYARLQPDTVAWRQVDVRSLPRPGQLLSNNLLRWIRNRDEQVGFWLARTMFKRDLNLTMRCWPSYGIVFAVVLLGLGTNQLGNPFVQANRNCLLSLASVYMLAMPIPNIFHNARFSREFQAAWVLQSSPIQDRFRFSSGLRNAVLVRFCLPTWLLMSVIFLAAWREPWHVVMHMVIGWLIILTTTRVCQMLQRTRVPFSEPLARGQTYGPIAIFAATVGSALTALAGLQFLAMQNVFIFLAYLAVILALIPISAKLTERRFLPKAIA